MKTKTLLLSLLSGAFLCFSTASYAQYHHSGSSSGGSGDGAFDEGQNYFDLGVGFVGGGSGYSSTVEDFSSGGTGNSYSTSSTPGIRIDWEHAKSEHIGYGLIFQYQSAKFTDNYSYQTQNYTITGYDQFGDPIYAYTTTTNNYTDTWTLTFITIAAQAAYHFSAGKNFDPYAGVTLGYVVGSVSYSSTNTDGLAFSGSASAIALGAHVGARYLFSDHIGAFAEFAYCTNYGENYVNVGLTFKF
jgi:hypothetical protein